MKHISEILPAVCKEHGITINQGDREMTKYQTNDEFMHYLMTSGSCPTGAMSQCFIIDAVAKHAERVVDNADECREKMKNSFIHPESWIATAQWIKETMDNRNKGE
tara:strand:+ start:96 stop:413 length:318 start_codon:yes stop_codon:yes gene_type:complete